MASGGRKTARIRLLVAGLAVVLALVLGGVMREELLRGLLFFPMPSSGLTPRDAGLAYTELSFPTEDGLLLHGWWIPAAGAGRRTASSGHVLLFHGNAGNIEGRLIQARLLVEAGLDVLLFDYRGYGRSQGSPSEEGTYRDARAARAELVAQRGVEPARIVYLGESLGGAVALELALRHPPRGLVLQSTFTGIRDMASVHYPFLPRVLVPNAYPSLRRIRELRAPLLVLHGDADDIVPLSEGRRLFDAAPEPRRLHVFPHLGHNDLVSGAGPDFARVIAEWLDGL